MTMTDTNNEATALRLASTHTPPQHLRDLVYIEHDEHLTDDDVGGLLSGDADTRQRTYESIYEMTGEQQFHGAGRYIAEELDSEFRDLLDKYPDTEEALRDRLYEMDTSNPLRNLIGNVHRKPVKVPTGFSMDNPDDGDNLAGHLVGLGASQSDADAAADELLANQGHYGGSLFVVWYADLTALLGEVEAVHHGNKPDMPYTWTWDSDRCANEWGHAHLVLWSGWNGAGHDVQLPEGVTVTAPVTAVRPEFRNTHSGWTWCFDCAGIYLPAYAATAHFTATDTK